MSLGALCHRSEVATIAGVAVMVAVALVCVVMSEGAPWLFLLRPSIDTAVMVAALIGGHCRRSLFRVRRSHRSEVATIADGQTVRRLGVGCRSCSLCLSIRL